MAMPALDLRTAKTAVVTIDLHRGHLDPSVATMPLPTESARQVTEKNARFTRAMRTAGVPVIHVVTAYRNVEEIASNPWWAAVAGTTASRRNVLRHQLPDSPGLAVMPEVIEPHDLTVGTKKRYDCFLHTDLEHAVRSLGVDTLLLTGVNTSSCVIATAIAANVRDFAAVVVADCVATMDEDLHEPALAIIRGAFGWVMNSDEVISAIGRGAA